MSAMTVSDNPELHRFEMWVAGERAGTVEYRTEPGLLVLLHTEIGEGFAGRGLGSVLVRSVLDEARSRGLGVVPECKFVRRYLVKHHDCLSLVPDDQRTRFEL